MDKLIIKLLNELHVNKSNGSLIGLSSALKYDLKSTKAILDSNSDYFLKNPKTGRYQINRFGKFKGDVERMIKDINDKKDYEKRMERNCFLIIFISMLTLLFTSL